MIEVESKYKISDPATFRRRASAIAKYSGKVKKVDDYYTLEDLKRYPKKSLRIRKKRGNYVVNFKRSISYLHGVHAKNEIEFTTSDIRGFLALITDMGFKRWLRKEKVTESYRISDRFHIEINNVRGLGWFIEVECLAKPDEIARARKKVRDIVKKLCLDEKRAIESGYTKQLWDEGKVF